MFELAKEKENLSPVFFRKLLIRSINAGESR
jgi:hypothetical protein